MKKKWLCVIIICPVMMLVACDASSMEPADSSMHIEETIAETQKETESVRDTSWWPDYPYDSTESFLGPLHERRETLDFMDHVYGSYLVTEVLKNNGFNMNDSSSTEDEADLMVGKEIVIKNEFFLTYDNFGQRPAEAYTEEELNQIEDVNQRIYAKFDGKPEIFRALVEYPYYVWSNSSIEREENANPSVAKYYGDREKYDYIQVRPGFMDSEIDIDADALNSTYREPGFWVIDENTVLLECMGWLFKAERIIDRGEE